MNAAYGKNTFYASQEIANTGAGTAIDVSNIRGGTLGVIVGGASASPAWNGTVIIQGSVDGTNYATLPTTENGYNVATLTGNGCYVVPAPIRFIRPYCSVHVAGTIEFVAAGEKLFH
jgi:hypothetical protein